MSIFMFGDSMEMKLLGVIWHKPELWPEISQQITSDMFLDPGCRVIWNIFEECVGKGNAVNDLRTTEQMHKKILEEVQKHREQEKDPNKESELAKSIADVMTYVDGSVGTTNPQFYVNEMKKEYLTTEKKRLENVGQQALADGKDATSIIKDLNALETKLEGSTSDDTLDNKTLADRAAKKWGMPYVKDFLSTGYRGLDNLTTGWRKKNLVILAGRPGLGKTAFALNLMLEASRKGNKSVFISTEMSTDELMTRIIAIESGVSARKIESGELSEIKNDIGDVDHYDMHNSLPTIKAYPNKFHILSKSCDMTAVETYCRSIAATHGPIDIIFIDYLQRIKCPAGHSREREVAEISTRAKDLAIEFDCTVVMIAQPSRAIDSTTRKNHMPQNSDLRDSGQIEQDADLIMWVHRESAYNPGVNEDAAKIILTKNRHGSIGEFDLKFKNYCLQFNEN